MSSPQPRSERARRAAGRLRSIVGSGTGASAAGTTAAGAPAGAAPAGAPGPAVPAAATVAGRYQALAALGPRYAEALVAADLTPYEAKVFSQNGEDGVIAEILGRIGVASRWFVEFGAGRGLECNCVLLADVLGWDGLFIELDDDFFAGLSAKYDGNARVRTVQAMVTPGNVEDLFRAAGVPAEPDVLSIDIDGADWWIWRAVTEFRPRLVVTEYNSNLPLDARVTVPVDVGGWNETAYFGATLGAWEALAATKGYRLVHTDLAGVNAFWVRDDLAAPFASIEPPRRRANYWLAGLQFPPPPEGARWIDVDADGEPRASS